MWVCLEQCCVLLCRSPNILFRGPPEGVRHFVIPYVVCTKILATRYSTPRRGASYPQPLYVVRGTRSVAQDVVPPEGGATLCHIDIEKLPPKGATRCSRFTVAKPLPIAPRRGVRHIVAVLYVVGSRIMDIPPVAPRRGVRQFATLTF